MSDDIPTPANDAPATRLPPHSTEAERGLLGAILLDAPRVVDICQGAGLQPEAFYHPAHRLVYEAVAELQKAHSAIDQITVGERLATRGRLDDVGGPLALERLADQATAAHAEYYLDLVRQKHLLRTIISTARATEGSCFDQTLSATVILANAEQNFLNIADASASASGASWPTVIRSTYQQIERLFALGPGGLSGLPSGLHNLDRVTRGLQPSEMIVLAARPSMGKTSLAMNIAECVAMGKDMNNRAFKGDHARQHPTALFSLEMSAESLALRMLCGRADVPSHRIESGRISSTEATPKLTRAAAELTHIPLFVDDTGGLDVMELRARARRMKKRHNIELVVIDYLQLLNCREYARQGRQLETSAISANLKAMAKELRIPVLVLSQLSRAPTQRDKSEKPKLSDLRDSGAIEQDADMVWLLRRPCKIDPENADTTLAIVDIAKNRNGPTGEVNLNFHDAVTRFADRADMEHERE
ncbi:MAG: replicative DNA helicase [Kiritimatiellaeota bacterium]|nr:replicative DNA helicase [Kiritimatiellota bacterium]